MRGPLTDGDGLIVIDDSCAIRDLDGNTRSSFNVDRPGYRVTALLSEVLALYISFVVDLT